MNKVDLAIAEAIIRTAVIDNHNDELKLLEQDTTPVFFSAQHERRIKQLFSNVRIKRTIAIIRNITRKIAVTAACVIAILSVVLMFNPTVKATVIETVTEFFDKFTNFRFNEGNVETELFEWELSWIPEEFTEIYHNYNGSITNLKYENSKGNLITFWAAPIRSSEINADSEHSAFTINNNEGAEYHIFTNTSLENPSMIIWISGSSGINVDNEHSIYTVKNIDKIEYYIFETTSFENPSTIIWINEGYCFTLTGYIDIETLEKMSCSFSKNIN